MVSVTVVKEKRGTRWMVSIIDKRAYSYLVVAIMHLVIGHLTFYTLYLDHTFYLPYLTSLSLLLYSTSCGGVFSVYGGLR